MVQLLRDFPNTGKKRLNLRFIPHETNQVTHPGDVIAVVWYPRTHSSNSRPTKTLASTVNITINKINLCVQIIVKISTCFSLFKSSKEDTLFQTEKVAKIGKILFA